MGVSYQYPGLFLLLLIFATYFLCSWFLKPVRMDYRGWKYYLLFANRWLILVLTAILLFKPEIKWQETIIDEQQHLLLLDNSRSLGLSDAAYTAKIKKISSNLLAENQMHSRLKIYTFGDSIRYLADTSLLTATDGASDLSSVLQQKMLAAIQNHGKIASLTVVSDGLFNRGENPLNLNFPFKVNCVTAGLPDQSVDLALQDAFFTENISADAKNRWEITLSYSNPQAPFTAEVIISRNNKKLQSHKIEIPSGHGELKIDAELGTPEKRIDDIEIKIGSSKKENNYLNNRITYYQKQSDSRDRVLIIADIPSLDSYFFTQLLKKNNIPFDKVQTADLQKTAAQKYKVVAVLSLSADISAETAELLLEAGNGILLFLNSTTTHSWTEKLLEINLPAKKSPVAARLSSNKNPDSDFLYNSDKKTIDLNGLPEIKILNDLQLPATRFIPVLNSLFQEQTAACGWIGKSEDTKIGVLNLENFWKNIFEVYNTGGNDNFSHFLINLIDYLSIDGVRQRLTVEPDKQSYNNGEPVTISGRYYDKNYLQLNNQKIRFRLKERKEEIILTAGKDKYTGTLNVKEPGYYEYIAEAVDGNKVLYSKEGSFKILQNNLETSKISPDTAALASLSRKNHGRLLPLDSLADWLKQLPEVKNERKISRSYFPTLQKWYLLLLVLLFTIEWLWRKIKG